MSEVELGKDMACRQEVKERVRLLRQRHRRRENNVKTRVCRVRVVDDEGKCVVFCGKAARLWARLFDAATQ